MMTNRKVPTEQFIQVFFGKSHNIYTANLLPHSRVGPDSAGSVRQTKQDKLSGCPAHYDKHNEPKKNSSSCIDRER